MAEAEWDEDEKPKPKPASSEPINWDSPISKGALVCLIFGHGNIDPTEWTDVRETRLRSSTTLAASLGRPSFLRTEAVDCMTRVVDGSIGNSKRDLATNMVACLKDIQGEGAELKKFKDSSPVFSTVSNKFRNRAWDFHVGTREGIYLYRKGKGTITRVIQIKFDEIGAEVEPGVFRVFKNDLYDFIYRKCIANDWEPEVLTVDATCNGKDCYGMNTTEVRAFLSEIEGLGGKESVIGGTKRKRKKRKSLKKKFK
jgi:hypothetical protein